MISVWIRVVGGRADDVVVDVVDNDYASSPLLNISSIRANQPI